MAPHLKVVPRLKRLFRPCAHKQIYDGHQRVPLAECIILTHTRLEINLLTFDLF